MSQYLEYQSLLEMKAAYRELFTLLEENGGELTPEIQESFALIDESYEEMIYRVWNIIKETEGLIANREAEIKRLQTKTATNEASIKSWKSMLLTMVKERGTPNANGNKNIKVNDLSFTVGKSSSVIVDDTFENPAYTTWTLAEKLKPIHKISILNFLKQQTGSDEIKFNKVVDKAAIKKVITNGGVVEGAYLEPSENITVR
jgi:hypothetical protein